jgi:hypothetical protein
MHGFLSRDGMPPGELLAAGRSEASGYGVEIIDDVVRVDPGFVVHRRSGDVLAARRVVVATGVGDELPDIPGVVERWGRDVLHCPYCHGWEMRDQPPWLSLLREVRRRRSKRGVAGSGRGFDGHGERPMHRPRRRRGDLILLRPSRTVRGLMRSQWSKTPSSSLRRPTR